jgi:hypothetical protein
MTLTIEGEDRMVEKHEHKGRGGGADHRDNQPTHLLARQPRRERPTGKTALAAGHDRRARPTAQNRTPEVALLNCW